MQRLLKQFQDGKKLPDGGAKILKRIQELETKLEGNASDKGTKSEEGDNRTDDDSQTLPQRSNSGSSTSAASEPHQPGPARKPAIIDAPKMTLQDYNRLISGEDTADVYT